jgi:hypothetical protein
MMEMTNTFNASNGDEEYLPNYKTDTLYINDTHKNITYVTLTSDIKDEQDLFIDISPKIRLAIRACYVKEKKDYKTFNIIKLKLEKKEWKEVQRINISDFNLVKMKEFIALIASLNLQESGKTKISLNESNIEIINTILSSNQGLETLKKLADDPALSHDIFAIGNKKIALDNFKQMLDQKDLTEKDLTEKEWQDFFEANPWIFGHGLNYVFLDKVGDKLEAPTTGASHEQSGKRVDALMRTRAMISQYVLIEIKKSSEPLLQNKAYRSGCWAMSNELNSAVTQIQKTTFEFATKEQRKVEIKDEEGTSIGESVYRIQPKSYLIIGRLKDLAGNDDKVICFELYRKSLTSPEIITYDELYERAKCIVETLSTNNQAKT